MSRVRRKPGIQCTKVCIYSGSCEAQRCGSKKRPCTNTPRYGFKVTNCMGSEWCMAPHESQSPLTRPRNPQQTPAFPAATAAHMESLRNLKGWNSLFRTLHQLSLIPHLHRTLAPFRALNSSTHHRRIIASELYPRCLSLDLTTKTKQSRSRQGKGTTQTFASGTSRKVPAHINLLLLELTTRRGAPRQTILQVSPATAYRTFITNLDTEDRELVILLVGF